MPITSGMVVRAPTAARAIPAALRASLLSRPPTRNPMPTPNATRVPAIRKSSGIDTLRSIILHLDWHTTDSDTDAGSAVEDGAVELPNWGTAELPNRKTAAEASAVLALSLKSEEKTKPTTET